MNTTLRSLTLAVICFLSIRGACFATAGVQPRTGLIRAWEPYQELFVGVVTCIHADFRIGGLDPGVTKQLRGKTCLVSADAPASRDATNTASPNTPRPSKNLRRDS